MRRLLRFICKLVGALVVLALALVVVANVYAIGTTRDDVYTVAGLEGAHADAIVVLGASVYADGAPSDMLKDRLDVAVDLYRAGAADTIIVSGDGRDSHYDEPDAMAAYCVAQGVPADAIVADLGGYNTYASMWRAQRVYGEGDIIVVTQAYHLYRALATAQGLGMQARGVAADAGAYDNQLYYSVREVFARTKAFVQTLLHVVPEEAAL